MKHLFTFLIASACLSAQAQIHLPLKDFQDQSITSGGWTNFIEQGTEDWASSDLGSTGDYYARFTNYNGSGNDTAIVWLISPSMDLSLASTPTLTFETACNYNGPQLQLMVSDDYDGVSAPSTANWTDITSSATISSGGFNWVASGDVDLSSYNGSSTVYVAFLYDGGPVVLGKTWEVDNIMVDETGTPPPTFVSIYDIQYTTGPGTSPYKDSTLATAGIVTAVASDGYFIQDGSGVWNGIYVYDQSHSVSIGDSIEIAGIVDEYYDMTQIENLSDFNLVSSGNMLPAAITVSTGDYADEMYESVLVKVENAQCTGTQGNGIWDVNDGSGVGLIQSGTTNGLYSYVPTVNNVYQVTGPVNYSFSEFKIWPRFAADIVNITGVDEAVVDINLNYDNINEVLSVKVPVDGSELQLLTASGKLVTSDSVFGSQTIDMSNFPAGIYIVRIQYNNSVVSRKILKP